MKLARVLGLLVAALAALAVLSSPSPVHAVDDDDGEVISFAFRLNTLLKDVVDEHAKSSEFGLSRSLRPSVSLSSASLPPLSV